MPLWQTEHDGSEPSCHILRQDSASAETPIAFLPRAEFDVKKDAEVQEVFRLPASSPLRDPGKFTRYPEAARRCACG